jgi:L-fuculose-phosphate aldolase
MTPEEKQLRQAIIDKCLYMNAQGLNQGTSGNISARYKDRILLTPSAVPYDEMTPEMIAAIPVDGTVDDWEGPLKPSTECHFHLRIMKERPDVNAIVHMHSTYATTLAMARKSIPAAHYMIAIFGGNDVRCGGYACYGTVELSEIAIEALKGRMACLLANHGMIALGSSLDKAMWHAVELETLAKMYYMTLAIGGPVILAPEQIVETQSAMQGYGLQDNRPTRKIDTQAKG